MTPFRSFGCLGSRSGCFLALQVEEDLARAPYGHVRLQEYLVVALVGDEKWESIVVGPMPVPANYLLLNGSTHVAGTGSIPPGCQG